MEASSWIGVVIPLQVSISHSLFIARLCWLVILVCNLSIYPNVQQGLLYFVLYKSTHLVKAYEESKKIIVSHVASG